MRHDVAVIGSGIGGSLIAALQAQDKEVLLLEKEPNLGGCASTFKHGKYHYNCGATTFAGYEEGAPLKEILDRIGAVPNLLEGSPAIRVIQGDKVIDRVRDFDTFLEIVEQNFPHPNNRSFWQLIHTLDQEFWQEKNPTYLKHTFKGKMKTLASIYRMQKVFGRYLYQNAHNVIVKYLPSISKAYLDFIDAQLLITLQAKSHEVSFISAAIGLAYPFHKLYYPIGGMGALFDEITKGIEHIHKGEQVKHIQNYHDKYFSLETDKGIYESKMVILNSTIFDSKDLFKDGAMLQHYQKFQPKGKGAFVLYMKIKNRKTFLHHYQVILSELIPESVSNAFFISFSDPSDRHMSKDGYSVTLSTHTDIGGWIGLVKASYREKKRKLETFLMQAFLKNFPEIEKEDIVDHFSATPKTFQRYILRANAGGVALTPMNFLRYPSTDTPVKNLYNVGDTIFPGQGWPGVAMGAGILQRRLSGER